jgi:hypothetical protein
MTKEKIAVFDASFKLVAIVSNKTQLKNLMGVSPTEIYQTLDAVRITCKKYYLRYIPKDIILDVDDLGKNLLLDFDQQCGLDMRVYTTRSQDKRSIILESELAEFVGNMSKRYAYGKPKRKRKNNKNKKNESNRDQSSE